MPGRKTLRFVALSLALLVPLACSRVEPVYTVQDRPMPLAAEKLTMAQIERNIMLAGVKRGWRFDPIRPGHLRGKQDNGKHSAVVDIYYTQQSYSIHLNSSQNLLQDETGIHRTYNRWIRYLENDIEGQLYSATMGLTN